MSRSCPYDAEAQTASLESLNHMPPPNQCPDPDQKIPLSTERQKSSIPMSQKYDNQVWIYPSEQMFYNAMKRKNASPHEQDMKTIVPIHNIVNEQAWKHILEWESLHADKKCMPRLVKFVGRSKDFTPKARFFQFLGYKLPFDRHDWIVDRCGTTVTYVIDFYSGASTEKGAPSFYLDVRPAMSIQGVYDRARMLFKQIFG
jgi:cytochrome c heme-lyase